MSIKKPFFEFALWQTVVILLMLVIYQLIYIIWPSTPPAEFIAYVFLVPYLINLLLYLLLLKAITLEPHYFIQSIILSIVLKLILFGAFNFVIIYLSPDSAMPDILAFFAIYICTTILEIFMLLPIINEKKK